MLTIAFVMSVNPADVSEYTRRHQPIWPELTQILLDHGVREYSIFLHPQTYQLFAIAQVESQERWDAIAQTEVCQRWWMHMAPLMPTHPDHRPVSVPLEPVFSLRD